MKHFELITEDELLEINIALYLAEQSNFVSTEQLISIFNFPEKRLRKIVNTLQKDLIDFNEGEQVITVIRNKGVFFDVCLNDDLKRFIAFLLNKNRTITLLSEIIFGRVTSISDYSSQFFIGESTIKRQLSDLRIFLKRYNLEISRGSYEIVGEEKQIQLFLYLFFWRITRGVVWPFDSIDENQMKLDVNNLISQLNVKNITEIDKRRLMFYLAINKIRISQSRTQLKNNTIDRENLGLQLNLEIAEDSRAKYEDVELYYQFFQSIGFTGDSNHDIKDSEATIATNKFMQFFEEKFFLIPGEHRKEVETWLFYCHSFSKQFVNFGCDINGYDYSEYINKYCKNLNIKLIEFIRLLKKETNLPLFEEEQYLSTHYMMIFAKFDKLPIYEKKIRIVLESGLPFFARDFVINQIKSYLGKKYNIELIDARFLEGNEKVDMALVTIPIKEISKKYEKAQLITINRDLSLNDLKKIEMKILSLKHA